MKAINGSQAVISALGSWGTPNKDVVAAAVKNIIPAMQNQNIKRIITLTGHGASAPGDKFDPLHEVSRFILLLLAPKILKDGEGHIKLLQATDLDWTAVRSSVMNNRGRADKFKLTRRRPLPLATINRQSVATGLIDLAETNQFAQNSPFIVRK